MADSAASKKILRDSEATDSRSPDVNAADQSGGDDATVHDGQMYINDRPTDQRENGDAVQAEPGKIEGIEVVDDEQSGSTPTQTALHQPVLHNSPNDGNGNEDGERTEKHKSEEDLLNQQTVISRRPQTLPPHVASPKDLANLLEGEQLGHFRLDEFVGGGGMGAVFRGTDLQLGRTVAVKVLSRDQGADPETLRRFKNEAQSAARLDHDNIARVFFVGEHDGWNFIVFEYIEGINLRDLVEQSGPLPLEQAIDFAVQMAEALEHASARDVVHRDIKPSNVLIAADGHAKLVDMGLARLHHMEAGHSDLTASGVTLGTFDYISPEQASDPRRADVRSDLYSLGCTLYFMLVGRPPFPHGTVLQKLLAHSGETPPDPRVENPELPAELSKIIFRLLAKRPEQRYQQPREFILELLVLRDQMGFGPLPLSLREMRSRRSNWIERWLPVGLPVILVLLVVFGLDAYWARTASSVSPPGFTPPPIVPVERLPQNDKTGEAPNSSESNSSAGTNTSQTRAVTSNSQPRQGSSTTTDRDAANVTRRSDEDTASRSAEETATSAIAAGATDQNVTSPEESSTSAPGEPSTPSGGSVEGMPDDSPIPGYRRFVIGDPSETGDLGPTVRTFATLADALASEELTASFDTLEAIEIYHSTEEVNLPLQIDLPADKQLVIRGVVGDDAALPKVRFVASPATTESPRGMIEFTSGRLKFENMHLQMGVSDEVKPDSDVSLIRLLSDAKKQLEMSKCIVTMENLGGAETAAFFDIAPPEAEVADAPPERFRFHLRDCLLRGEGTVFRMRVSVPLQVTWQNGLLATSERFLLAEGTPHSVDDTTIRLSLLNVTAEVGKGLCLLRDSQEQPNQPGLELVCNKTIINAGSSNLVEHAGINAYDVYQRSLFLRGDWNVYEDVASFWSVSSDDEEKPGMDWAAWNEKLRMSGGMPSSVNPIGWIRLRSDVAGIPMHARSVEDYLLDDSDPGSAETGEDGLSGLQREMMPPLPESVEAALPAEDDPAT